MLLATAMLDMILHTARNVRRMSSGRCATLPQRARRREFPQAGRICVTPRSEKTLHRQFLKPESHLLLWQRSQERCDASRVAFAVASAEDQALRRIQCNSAVCPIDGRAALRCLVAGERRRGWLFADR